MPPHVRHLGIHADGCATALRHQRREHIRAQKVARREPFETRPQKKERNNLLKMEVRGKEMM